MTPKAFNRTCSFKLQMVYLLLSSLKELLTIFGEDSFSNISKRQQKNDPLRQPNFDGFVKSQN